MGWTFSTFEEERDNVKTRKRPSHDEDRLEANCVRWFDIQHKDKQLLMHHSPNEGNRSEREGARNRKLGTRRGFPDLIFLKSNKYFDYLAIELKTPTGRLTTEQSAYRKVVNESGGCYIIIRKFEDFMEAIEQYLQDNDMKIWIKNK